MPALHLPVAFIPQQGDVTVTQACSPASMTLLQNSTCTVTATNGTFNDTTADFTTTTTLNLPIVGASGATVANPFKAEKKAAPLAGAMAGTPSIAPGTIAGYIPLDLFGGTPVTPVGDEEILTTFNVPPFKYNGVDVHARSPSTPTDTCIRAVTTATRTTTAATSARSRIPRQPNNVLAPFWTDLDGTGRDRASLRQRAHRRRRHLDRRRVAGERLRHHQQPDFQVWLGSGGAQDIAFSYDPATIASLPGRARTSWSAPRTRPAPAARACP